MINKHDINNMKDKFIELKNYIKFHESVKAHLIIGAFYITLAVSLYIGLR